MAKISYGKFRILICAECNSEFSTNKPQKVYCSPICQRVRSKRLVWLNKKISYKARCRDLLAQARGRSKIQNRPFTIEHQDLVDLWEEQSGKCAVSGIPFNLDFPEKAGEARFDAPSLDRIVPTLGYVKGNIRFVIYQVNMAIGPYGLDRFLKTIETIRGLG